MSLLFNGTDIAYNAGDTLLEAVERSGYMIDSGCRSGVCHLCLVKALPGRAPKEATKGLSAQQIQDGYFLSCQMTMSAGTEIEVLSGRDYSVAPELFAAKVVDKRIVNDRVCLLGLETDAPYLPGQYIMLEAPDGMVRPYSVASARPGFVELHVGRVIGGACSGWIMDEVSFGDVLFVSAGRGDCIFTEEMANKPLLMVGVGTGIAPIIGMIRAAYTAGHKGLVTILHGARDASGLYAGPQLTELSQAGAKVMQLALDQGGDIYREAVASFKDIGDCRVVLCGARPFVGKMKKQIFLAGAPMKNIKSEAFT